MKHYMSYLICVSSLFCGVSNANCIPEHVESDLEKDVSSKSIYLDQDLFLPKHIKSDQDYTMGFEVSASGKWIYKMPVYCQLAKGLHGLNSLFGDYDDINYIEYYHAGGIGDTAFTPRDIGNSDPIEDDRPYANLIYLSVGEHAVKDIDSKYETALTTKFIIGALGLNIGRSVQTWIHEKGDSPIPNGWGHQISDGGELTALYYRRHMRNYGTVRDIGWDEPEFVTYWDYSLGYYVEATAGARVRLGTVNTRFFEHVSDPIMTGNHTNPKEKDFYLFLDVSTKLNLYNAMLQGQKRESEVTYSYDDIRHVFGQVSAGVVWGFGNHSLSYVYHYRGSELKNGEGDRAHHFGGLYYSYIME